MMTTKYLIDTEVLIKSLSGEDPYDSLVAKWIQKDEIAFSSIVVAEFMGKASELEIEKLSLLLDEFGVAAVDRQIAESAGLMQADLARKGVFKPISVCILASTAKVFEWIVATTRPEFYKDLGIEILEVS